MPPQRSYRDATATRRPRATGYDRLERASVRVCDRQDKGRTYPARQRAVYSLADAVVHISAADAVLERRDFNHSCVHWRVLRMSPRGVRAVNTSAAKLDEQLRMLSQGQAPAQGPSQGRSQEQLPTEQLPTEQLPSDPPGAASRIGFMGNGITPTNHLSIEWFLREVWPSVRSSLPSARLRLVGYLPDDRPKRLQGTACSASSSESRCGWAWRTPYAGAEAAGGVDELGFLSDEAMVDELLSWRAMVVPILRTTGVNTKLLPALQLGVPIVLTSVAASPLGIKGDDAVALVADDAEAFVKAMTKLEERPEEARRLAVLCEIAARSRH